MTAPSAGRRPARKPKHELKFYGCRYPDGVMAACEPCGYHELLGDGLTFDTIAERTKEHQPCAGRPQEPLTAR